MIFQQMNPLEIYRLAIEHGKLENPCAEWGDFPASHVSLPDGIFLKQNIIVCQMEYL